VESDKKREYGWMAAVGAVLLAAVLLVRHFDKPLRHFMTQHSVLGVIVYITLNITDAVIAPGSTLTLIPVAAKAWGRLPAAFITVAGWTAGSLLAFFLARHWGAPLVSKIAPMSRVQRLKKYIPQRLFWSVVVLRFVLPMDVMSYVLGLFTRMPWLEYAGATALGLVPSALVLTYLGKTSHGYEIMMLAVAGAAIAGIVYSTHRQSGGRSKTRR
jgi:uncharacterized membrane protein YdjX (TVP38/TMEM64 family)